MYIHVILLCTEKLVKKIKGNLEFSLAIQNQVMGAVLHEIECFMEMQEMDFLGGRMQQGLTDNLISSLQIKVKCGWQIFCETQPLASIG